MRKQTKADLMLLFVTMSWGLSYLMMRYALADVAPMMLNVYRFGGAFLLAGLFTFKRLKKVNWITLKYSFLVGVSLFFVYVGATYGILHTSISNAGFLCALTVIFVPLLEFLLFRRRPPRRVLFAAILSLVGIMLLTLKSDFSINLEHWKGDLLCMTCALAYAADLIITDRALGHEEVDAYSLGVFQLGAVALMMAVFSGFLETPTLPASGLSWFAVIFLSIFCTGLAFIVQALAQQYTTPAHVGIIFALEPVFSGVAAFAFAGERLTGRAYIGAAIMVAALLLAELAPEERKSS